MSWVRAAGPARDRARELVKEIGADPYDFDLLEGTLSHWMNTGRSPRELLGTVESHMTGNPIEDIMQKYPVDLTWDNAIENLYMLIDIEGWTPRTIIEALES